MIVIKKEQSFIGLPVIAKTPGKRVFQVLIVSDVFSYARL
jgi:hypothetical protein